MGNAESAAQYYVEYASKRREENEAKEAKEVVEKTGLGMHTDIFSYNLRPTPIERVLNTKQTFSNSHYLVKEGRLFKRSGIRTVSLHISTQFPDCPELFGKMFVMIYTDSKTDNEDIPPIYVHCMGLPFAEVSKNINHHVKTIYAQGRTCMVCMVTKPAEMHKRCANETKVTKRILEEEKGIKKSWNMSWFDSADIEKENMRHVIVSPSTIKVEHSVSVYPTEGYGKRAVTNTVFAWASLVCGITNKPISGVPIIWRKSQGSMHTIRPILRERKHGDANDENLSMFDYSEASTSKSVILSCKFSGGNSALTTDSNIARYNALKSAPMPYEGVISVPVERSDQTRRMRLVDVMICHPMIQGWVNNCTVSVKYTSGKYTVLERNAVVEADKTTLVVSRCYEEPLTKQPIPDLSKKLKRMSIQDLENPFGYTHNEEEQEEEDEDPLLFNRRTKRVVPEKLPTKESLSELLHQGTPTEEEQRDEGEDIKDVKPPIIPIYAIESTSDECASTNSTTDVDDITSSPSFTESSSSMEEDWSSTALADEPRMRKHLNRSSIRMKSAMRDIGQIPLSSETETTPAKKPKKKKKLRLGLKKLNNSEKDRKVKTDRARTPTKHDRKGLEKRSSQRVNSPLSTKKSRFQTIASNTASSRFLKAHLRSPSSQYTKRDLCEKANEDNHFARTKSTKIGRETRKQRKIKHKQGKSAVNAGKIQRTSPREPDIKTLMYSSQTEDLPKNTEGSMILQQDDIRTDPLLIQHATNNDYLTDE